MINWTHWIWGAMRQLKSSTRQLKNSWLELRRGARIMSQWVKLWKQNERETYTQKTGVEHSSEDIEIQEWKGTLVSMVINSLQGVEKRRIFTLWIMSSLLYTQFSTSPWSRSLLSLWLTFYCTPLPLPATNAHVPQCTPT